MEMYPAIYGLNGNNDLPYALRYIACHTRMIIFKTRIKNDGIYLY